MYNEQLEKLIEFALKDGELSEKERFLLIKKAGLEGIDATVFELDLENRLAARKLFLKQNPEVLTQRNPVAPAAESRNCPGCGAQTDSFQTRCPHCGYEYRNIQAARSITDFLNRLDEIESTRTEDAYDSKKASGKLGCGTLLMWYFFFWILLPYNIIVFLINKSKPPKWTATDTRKEEFILNYPVPFGREDIIEFVTLSASKIQRLGLYKRFSDEGKYIAKWNSIWKQKCQQVFSKAKISMVDDRKTLAALEEMMKSSRLLK